MLVRGKYWRVLFFLCLIFCVACSNEKHAPRAIERAFYHWQSVWQPDAFEKQQLDSLQVNDLYIKYFDVDWDPVKKQASPIAIVRFKEKPAYKVVPVVFITNECIRQTDTAQIPILAEKIISLIQSINVENKIDGIQEIQIDCDWSKETKDKYFKLLSTIGNSTFKIQHSKLLISATIRLYQIKYLKAAGVPPVDKGLLMCYNMGNLKDPAADNSIIELKEFKKYMANLSDYPLPLDVALPIFAWKVWFRNAKYHGITEEFPDSLLMSPAFTKTGSLYQVKNDTVLAGYEFKKDDQLRYETSDINEVLAVANTVSNNLKNTSCTVSLYHLDALILKKYTTHELESIYNSLH